MDLIIVILAAGKGTRMGNSLPKVCHLLNGKSMLQHIIETSLKLNPYKIIVVVSPSNMNYIQEIVNGVSLDENLIKTSIQYEQLGTGHAVLSAKDEFIFTDTDDTNKNILVLYGDVPLIRSETLDKMIKYSKEQEILHNIDFCGIILTMNVNNKDNRYGRIILSENNIIIDKIVEYNDANDEEKEVTLCNTGIILLKSRYIIKLLTSIKNDNNKQEYYLTDVVKIAKDNGLYFVSIEADLDECHGVNTIQELEFLQNNKFIS